MIRRSSQGVGGRIPYLASRINKPMLSEQQLSKLYSLKRDRGSGWEKPYKPALDGVFELNRALIA